MNARYRILVIDRQSYWLRFAAEALSLAGFVVSTSENYPPELAVDSADLIVLGCARVGSAEQELITHILEKNYHLLVFCAFLPWHVMRLLFLQGVDDVADKPYSADSLVSTVHTLVAGRLSHDQAEKEEVLL